MSKKIIIIGSRRRNGPSDYQSIWEEFRKHYENGDIIVSGGCPKGGDKFAEMIAQKLGMTRENGQLIIHLPKKPPQGSPRYMWAKAMYDRNTVVANEAEENTIVIATVASDRKGGTEDTIKKIQKKNVLYKDSQIKLV